MPPTWVADETFLFLYADGRRSRGRIAIGMPEVAPEGEGRCALHIDGMEYGGGRGLAGESPLQALCLALRLAGVELHDFRKRGGRVLHPDEEFEIDLAHYFGPLLCDPPPPTDDDDDDDSAET